MRKLETQKTARLAKIIAKDNKKAIFQVSSESEVHEALGLPLGANGVTQKTKRKWNHEFLFCLL